MRFAQDDFRLFHLDGGPFSYVALWYARARRATSSVSVTAVATKAPAFVASPDIRAEGAAHAASTNARPSASTVRPA